MTKQLRLTSKKEFFEQDVSSREHQHLLKVTILEDGFNPQIIRVQESSHLRNEALVVADKPVTIGGYTREYSNMNHDVVILNLAEMAESDYIKHFSRELWISNDLKQLVVINPESGSYIDWTKSEVVESFDPTSQEYMRLKPSFMSPSQEKKKEITCLRWDADVEKYEALLDSMTDGAYSLFNDGSEMSYSQLVKGGARLAQGLSPSADMKSYGLSSVAILLSKSRREFADGGGFFVSKKGYPVGLGAQLRNHATDKWFGLCIDDQVMSGLTKHYGKVVYVDKEIAEGRVTAEEAQEYIAASFGRSNRGPWAEKTVVLGKESGTPDVFIDLNIVKAPMNFLELLPTSLKVLDLAGPIQKDTVVFGSQMLFSMLLSEEGKDLIGELLLETVSNSLVVDSSETEEEVKALSIVLKEIRKSGSTDELKADSERLTTSIINKFHNKAPRVPSFYDFDSSLDYSAGLIDMVNPLWARTMDQGTKRSIEKALANKISGTLSEFQPEVEGKFCRVLADFSAGFGLTLLEDNEICAPDLPSGEVVGIRSPKGGIKEQGIYNNISVREMTHRIKKSSISKDDKFVLTGLFQSLRTKSQVAIVPSSDEVKLLHSGMDFDFDGVTFITDERIVNILKKTTPVAVRVTDEGGVEDNRRYALDVEHMTTLIEKQFNNGNLPVGIVCNHNHTWVMLLSNLQLARNVLKHLNGGGDTMTYKGLEYAPISHNREIVEINAKKTSQILSEFKRLDYKELDDKTIVRILEDINVMMNRYIQVTIDASKSGEVVEIPEALLINDEVLTASLTNVEFSLYERKPDKTYFTLVEDKLHTKIFTKETTMHPVQVGRKKKFIFNDAYHAIRTDVARLATRVLVELVTKDARLDEATTLRRDRVKYNKNEFLHFAHVFNDINAATRNLLNKENPEESADINSDFRDTISYLGNSIRIATPSMTTEERVLAAIDVATDKRSDVNAAANMFPSATLVWEYINLCSNHGAGINFVGEPIFGITDLEDKEEVTIIDGSIAREGSINVVDGLYTVREYEGRFYATKSIEELTAPFMATNKKLIIRMSSGQDFIDITKDIANKPVNVLSYKNSPIGKDCINGVHRIDLPTGYSNYAKVIDGVEANIKKQALSTTRTKRGSDIRQLFLCLELHNNIVAQSTKAVKKKIAPKAKRSMLTVSKETTLNSVVAQEAPSKQIEAVQDNSKLEIARQARAAYESLSDNEKATFPAEKLARLENLEVELGISATKVKQAVDIFDLL